MDQSEQYKREFVTQDIQTYLNSIKPFINNQLPNASYAHFEVISRAEGVPVEDLIELSTFSVLLSRFFSLKEQGAHCFSKSAYSVTYMLKPKRKIGLLVPNFSQLPFKNLSLDALLQEFSQSCIESALKRDDPALVATLVGYFNPDGTFDGRMYDTTDAALLKDSVDSQFTQVEL